jgi:hypothetical protein
MKKLLFTAFIIALLVSCKQEKIILTDSSGSNYEIVLANEEDTLISYAARELQGYMEKISGVRIPIVSVDARHEERHEIFLGTYPESQGYNPHLTRYMTKGNNFLIAGGSSLSVLYSVYSFLENELGCLWLSPEVEIIPQSDKIILPSDLTYEYTPVIETRTVHSRLFYDNPAFADKHRVTHEAFPGYIPEARVHTFHRFMPADSFYDKHPEYYALRNGKRLPT